MIRVRVPLALALLLALTAPAFSEGKLKEGKYKLGYYPNASLQINYWILEVKDKDGKLSGSIASTPVQASKLNSFKVSGGEVTAKIQVQTIPISFEGKIDKGGKKVLGSLSFNNQVFLSVLEPTEDESIPNNKVQVPAKAPEPYTKANQLSRKALIAHIQAQRAKDEQQKAKLTKDAEAASKEAAAEMPKLYREVLAKHADSPAVFDAALSLFRRKSSQLDAGDVKKWVALLDKKSAAYGKRWHDHILGEATSALAYRKDGAEAVLPRAKAAVEALKKDAPPAEQVRVLDTYEAALRNSGAVAEARKVADRVEKINEKLDKEYHEKVPPFKPQPVKREGTGDRVVLMELFTGAQCPPCVAADVAFDALLKSYKPTDVVFLQYHLHIPGPDPLTNKVTEERAAYYSVNSTPSTLFDGKSKASGGGAMANAKNKYDAYREVIDPALKDTAEVLLKAKATESDGKVTITVDVDKLIGPGESKKLRVVLVEESVRYIGGNGLRFHHHVVRDMPGGVKGVSLTKKQSKHTLTADLAAVRKKLAKYVSDYEENRQSFPSVKRPMDLKKLKVIAFVQDDESKEVLNAVQVGIASAASKTDSK
jgi:hypothetical protein